MGTGSEESEVASRARRRDPALDRRRLVAYAAGLMVSYVVVWLLVGPDAGDPGALNRLAPGLMFAPTVGALAAVAFAWGRIQFGRPSTWMLAAFVPPVVILAVTTALSAWSGSGIARPGTAQAVLLVIMGLPVAALFGSLTAIGEEVGWRGFLWPLLRRHTSFWLSSVIMVLVWFGYHVPVVLIGLYGSVAGLPAFFVAIVGFVLFVGVLTERSSSIWPSVLAHGVWNGSVAVSFAGPFLDPPLFTGSAALLGEFGWVAALSMIMIGVSAAIWHARSGRAAIQP